MTNINATSGIPQYSPSTPASFGYDAFGRTKVSEPYTLFDSTHRYKPNEDYSDLLGGGGSTGYLVNESTVTMNVGTVSGDYVYRETNKVFPYQPGKALTVMQTFVMAPTKANLRQRVGYFSRQNGVFLQMVGDDISIVRRSFISGAVDDLTIPKSQWNVDKMDGNGPSRTILNLAKAQILFSEYEWLGVGSVKVGFAIDGQFITVHQFNHANKETSVYMTTATLPLRYEIENLGTTSSASTMKQICATVLSNGGYNRQSELWSAPRAALFPNVGTSFKPLAAIRMASGRTDSVIKVVKASVVTTTQNSFEFVILKNPTISDGSWVTHSTGNVEYNITATTVTGGTVIRQSFMSGSNQTNAQAEIEIADGWDVQLGRTNTNPPVSDIYVVAARTLSGTGDIIGALHWFDLL